MVMTKCKCGENPEIVKDGAHWFVQCLKCNRRTNSHNTARDAIRCWNEGFVFEI